MKMILECKFSVFMFLLTPINATVIAYLRQTHALVIRILFSSIEFRRFNKNMFCSVNFNSNVMQFSIFVTINVTFYYHCFIVECYCILLLHIFDLKYILHQNQTTVLFLLVHFHRMDQVIKIF